MTNNSKSKSENSEELSTQTKQETKLVKIDKPKKPKKPESERWYYKFLGCIGRGLMRIIWPVHIYCRERAVLDKRAIYICNHYSVYDANAILTRVLKKPNVVLKSEAASNKFMVNIFKQVGGIPIKRNQSDIVAIKAVLKVLNKDEQILIFPEGSRNRNDIKEMLAFQDGVASFALKTKCQIVPCMYYNEPRIFRKNRLMIGEPFDLSQFYDNKSNTVRKEATDYIYHKMLQLREEIDYFVEVLHSNKKKFKKYLENKNK